MILNTPNYNFKALIAICKIEKIIEKGNLNEKIRLFLLLFAFSLTSMAFVENVDAAPTEISYREIMVTSGDLAGIDVNSYVFNSNGSVSTDGTIQRIKQFT